MNLETVSIQEHARSATPSQHRTLISIFYVHYREVRTPVIAAKEYFKAKRLSVNTANENSYRNVQIKEDMKQRILMILRIYESINHLHLTFVLHFTFHFYVTLHFYRIFCLLFVLYIFFIFLRYILRCIFTNSIYDVTLIWRILDPSPCHISSQMQTHSSNMT